MDIISFGKGIMLLAFGNQEELFRHAQHIDELFNKGKYPALILQHDTNAPEEEIEKVKLFIRDVFRSHTDLQTVKRNLEKNRLRVTGDRPNWNRDMGGDAGES